MNQFWKIKCFLGKNVSFRYFFSFDSNRFFLLSFNLLNFFLRRVFFFIFLFAAIIALLLVYIKTHRYDILRVSAVTLHIITHWKQTRFLSCLYTIFDLLCAVFEMVWLGWVFLLACVSVFGVVAMSLFVWLHAAVHFFEQMSI